MARQLPSTARKKWSCTREPEPQATRGSLCAAESCVRSVGHSCRCGLPLACGGACEDVAAEAHTDSASLAVRRASQMSTRRARAMPWICSSGSSRRAVIAWSSWPGSTPSTSSSSAYKS